MPTLLISAPYIIPSMDRFAEVFERHGIDWIIAEVEERLNEDRLLEYAGQFDGTVCGDDQYTAQVLEACTPRLKVISKWGTGIDSIDKTTAEKLGIQVYRTPNAFTLPVSDTVLGYILSFARKLPMMDRAMKAGRWQKIPGFSLSEQTLGVIGVGRIGKAVIRRASASPTNAGTRWLRSGSKRAPIGVKSTSLSGPETIPGFASRYSGAAKPKTGKPRLTPLGRCAIN